MRGGDLHIRIQDIFETSVRFDGDIKNVLQSETLNANKNKSYYQLYDVNWLRAFHKQAIIKQQIYDNMLARRSGVDYSQGMQFHTNLINMEEAQEVTINNQTGKNQQKRCWCVSLQDILPKIDRKSVVCRRY